MFTTKKRFSKILLISVVISIIILIQLYTGDYSPAQIQNNKISILEQNIDNNKDLRKVQNFVNEYYTDPTDSLQTTNVYLATDDYEHNKNSNNLAKLQSAIKIGTPFESEQKVSNMHMFFKNIINTFVSDCNLDHLGKLNHYKNDYTDLFNSAFHTKDRKILSENYLNDFLQVEKGQIRMLQHSHRKAVETINKIDTDFITNQYNKNQNGIAIVGGEGKFNWLTLLSIKQLRSIGSKLPVEVIIPTLQDYEIEFCENVLPKLNAKCVLLPQILGSGAYKESNITFSGYQYKVLAILASSFENVLLMDADNLPFAKPDSLFKDDVFLDHGMVTWPDYWERTTSPKFFRVADVELGKKRASYGYDMYGIYKYGIIGEDIHDDDYKNVPLHDREGSLTSVSSESGQLLVSKKTHFRELLLAFYYNLYGPYKYYPLLTQGSSGEGDKDTFAISAFVLNGTFYQVRCFLKSLGYKSPENEYTGTAMVQFDPSKDYKFLKHNMKILNKSKIKKKFESVKEAESYGIMGLIEETPPPMFVHANLPKLEPIELKNKYWGDNDHKRIRLLGFGDVKTTLNDGTGDFELSIWEIMHATLCVEKVKLSLFTSDHDNKNVCQEINHQLAFLKSNPL